MKLKVVDLFAGCGGLSLGLCQAGYYKVVAANEFWDKACDTWEANHNGKMVRGDITKAETRQAIYDACGGSCDIVVGGPPCVAYSMSGRRDPADPRGKLFEQYVEIVSHLKPKAVIMENVVGILSMKHGRKKVTETIVDKLAAEGYVAGHKTLLAADYGVPQMRERVIFVGFRSSLGLYPSWPKPSFGKGTCRLHRTIRQSISGLEGALEDKSWSHIFMRNSDEFTKRIHRTHCGKSVTDYSEAFFRAWPDRPAPTIKANNGAVLVHYKFDRCMTPRELARLQSFPDDFMFKGGKQDVLKQIGNAVPPGLAKALGEHVAKVLSGEVKTFPAECIFETGYSAAAPAGE